MKTINIVYLPGYGGNFLECLFSLDQSTVPAVPIDIEHDTPQTRSELYCRPNLSPPRHMGDIKSKYNISESILHHYTVNVQSVHPEEYCSWAKHSETKKCVVDLDWSNFSNYWLQQSKIDFDYQLARLRIDEAEKNARLLKQHGIIIINLNNMLDINHWRNEYCRISSAMNLPIYSEPASMIYHCWYELRVKKYVDNFMQLDSDQHAKYCYLRLKEEQCGTITSWKLFYERVRDPDWPDCPYEQDFCKLPERIRHELIDVFKYRPQIPS